MEKYEMIIEKKNGRKYDYVDTNTDKDFVLWSFIGAMKQRFLWESKSIFRVETRPNYDGTMTVKFSMDNGYRYTFIIPDR